MSGIRPLVDSVHNWEDAGGRTMSSKDGTPARIYPVDAYDFPGTLIARCACYHFLRIPLLGQHNPQGRGDNWCGRTSSTMLRNYRKLALGQIQQKEDYVTHWVGDASVMDLRRADGKVVADGFVLSELLSEVGAEFDARVHKTWKILPLEPDTREERRLRVERALAISRDPAAIRKQLAPVLSLLKDRNNPALLYSGFSTGGYYRSHIVLISGYCELPDRNGSLGLWLLIADPAPPKLDLFTPPCESVFNRARWSDWDDCGNLAHLEEGKDSIIRIVKGDGGWNRAEGSLYLVRASSLFKPNLALPDDALLMDYTYDNSPADGVCYEIGGSYSWCEEKTPYDSSVVISNLVNNLVFPFQKTRDFMLPPLAQFQRAEGASVAAESPARGASPLGFYPVGSNQLVHSGVHLASPQEAPRTGPTDVHCMGPGYIVAARLRKAPAHRYTATEAGFLGAYSGFVLVRHELELRSQPAAPTTEPAEPPPVPKRLPFYSLYMHLMPTTWPYDAAGSSSDDYDGVGWLRQLYFRRFKAIVNLDPDQGPVGRVYWAASEVSTNAGACDVYAEQTPATPGASQVTHHWLLKDAVAGHLAYVREPPAQLKKAYEGLVSGKVVTFSRPILPLNYGDTLGFAAPIEIARGRSGTDTLPACIHWEVLCPPGTQSSPSAFEELASRAASKGVTLSSIDDIVSDNFVGADEIASTLKPLLPSEDKKALDPIVKEVKLLVDSGAPASASRLWGTAVTRFYASEATFASPPKEEPPLDGASYVIKLVVATPVIEGRGTPLPPPTEGYGITAIFKDETGTVIGEPQELTISDEKRTTTVSEGSGAAAVRRAEFELELVVPANAHTVKLEPSGNLILDRGEDAGVDYSLCRDALQHRWRGLRLQHQSEWSSGALKKLIKKLAELKLSNIDGSTSHLLEAAWFGPPSDNGADAAEPSESNAAQATTSLGEVPTGDTDGQNAASLFGSLLPSDAVIQNLHPVTLLWLLKLLQQDGPAGESRETVGLRSQWDLEESSDALKPKFWGWFYRGPRVCRVGHDLYAVAIADSYKSGSLTLKARRDGATGDADDILLKQGPADEGIFVVATNAPMWGRWRLIAPEAGSGATSEKQGSIEADPALITIAAPVAHPRFELVKDPKTRKYRLTLHFTENCPVRLAGYFVVEWAKVKGEDDEKWPESVGWLLDRNGGFVVGLVKGVGAKVTASFTLSDYTAVVEHNTDEPAGAPPTPHVALTLCKAVETVAQQWAAQTKGMLKLTSLSADGFRAVLAPVRPLRTPAAVIQRFVSQVAPKCAPFTTEVKVWAEDPEGRGIVLEASAPPTLSWERSAWCLPLVSAGPKLIPSDFVIDDECVVGLRGDAKDSAKLSPNFTYGEWSKACAPRPMRVHLVLRDALQKLRSSLGLISLTLLPGSALADGRGVDVVSSDWSNAAGPEGVRRRQRYVTFAQDTHAFSSVELVQEGVSYRLRLVVNPSDPSTAGDVTFELQASELFGRVLGEARPDAAQQERVALRASFLCPNGMAPIDSADHLGSNPIEVALQPGLKDRLAATAGKEIDTIVEQDRAQAGTGATSWIHAVGTRPFKRLAFPGFDAGSVSMKDSTLVVTFPLRGARVDWEKAAPIVIAHIDGVERSLGGAVLKTATAAVLRAELSLLKKEKAQGKERWVADPAVVNKRVTVSAVVPGGSALFDNELIAITQSSIDLGAISPGWEAPLHTDSASSEPELRIVTEAKNGRAVLRLSGQAKFVPTSQPFVFTAKKRGEGGLVLANARAPQARGNRVELLEKLIKCRTAAPTNQGTCRGDGLIEAELEMKYLEEGAHLVFELAPVGEEVLGRRLTAVSGTWPKDEAQPLTLPEGASS